MPAIQNQINLYVNANGQLVPGSEPSDVLYRNNINRNVFFVITPLSQASVVKMIFRNTSLARQGYTGIAFMTNQKGANITSEEVSYYELVKDWSVFKFVPNSTILTKFPSSISGSIGLTVSIKEPDLSDKTQWTFKDNLLDANYDYSTIKPREYVRCLASSLVVPTFGTIYSGDCIVNVPDKGLALIRLLWTRSTTDPLLFVGNPALEDTDFEDAEIGDASLLDTVISMQNQQTQAIVDVNDRMLPKDGTEPMEGNLNMGGNEITGADNVQFNKGGAVGNLMGNDFTIILGSGETFTFSENGLNMFSRKLIDVAKGVNSKDGANMENIYNLESDVDDLETEIGNIKNGATIVKKAEQDQLGNVINTTYETKADANLAKVRITLLENANMVKDVYYEPTTHVITFTFFDGTTQLLDLPLESTIVSASYDNITKDITFTLQNGETLVVPLDDLVEGLANETWVMENFIPKTALKSEFSTVPLNTNVPSEKLVKDQLDLTAKLAVSNVFTQPQQVPNATLPQHATNKLQVETMFEMIKQQLRGYNLAKPDLTGKEYLGNGVYRLLSVSSGGTVNYNVYNGNYIIDGLFGNTSYISNNLGVSGVVSGSYYYVSGELLSGSFQIDDYNTTTFITRSSSSYAKDTTELNYLINNHLNFYINANSSFNNFTIKLQIEKGDTATPYTVPGQIPQYSTDLSQVGLFSQIFYRYGDPTITSNSIVFPGGMVMYIYERNLGLPERIDIPKPNLTFDWNHNTNIVWDLTDNQIKRVVYPDTIENGIVLFKNIDGKLVGGVMKLQYEMSLVIDLDLERLIMNIDLEDNELVFTFEDGTIKRIPLGSLLVGMASEQWVNAKLDNYYNEGEVDGLLGAKVNTSDIVNNLTSTDTDKPLSANQGKVLQDTTAKLAVSNVFTQPQQVPNATLPQHATNKLQVETMFEMIKQQLRGYNLGGPDLTGKEYLGDGWYRVINQGWGGVDVDYNVYQGYIRLNGEATEAGWGMEFFNTRNTTHIDNVYTYSIKRINGVGIGGSGDCDFGVYVSNDNRTLSIYKTGKYTTRTNIKKDNDNSRITLGATGSSSEVVGRVYDNVIFQVQIEKGDTATPYTVPGQIPQYSTDLSLPNDNKIYKSIGKTLAKTNITRTGAPNGGTVMGNEYWAFQASNDENTNYADCHRWLINEETLELTHLGSFQHNWGHVNSVDYCIETDTLICGNGSGSYVLDGKIFIFENASSFKEMSQVTLIDNAIIIDVGMTYGVKVNVVWGNDNDGRYDIAHVITNDNKDIIRIQLGKGTNDLGLGNFVSGKLSNEFNGSYKVLKTWSQIDGGDVVQGADYGEDGFLYVGLGHSGAWYAKQWLNDDGSINGEVSKTLFINQDGTTNGGFTQSISEYKDKLILRIVKDDSYWAYVINK